jgi:hypothetical protein
LDHPPETRQSLFLAGPYYISPGKTQLKNDEDVSKAGAERREEGPRRRIWLDTRDDLYQSVTHVWPILSFFSHHDQALVVLYNGCDIMN